MTAPLVDDTLQLADGRTLAWAEFGAADGEPLFMFHGLPGSRLFSGLLVDAADAHGVRIIAPDRPGFGKSTFQPDRTFLMWADDVAALADHLGIDRFFVAGISGGGPYTLAVPHQLGARVRAAGVISGGGEMSTDDALEGMHAQNRAIFEIAKAGGPAGVAEAMKPMLEMLEQPPDPATADAGNEGLPEADVELLARRPEIGEALRLDGIEALRNGVDGAAYEACMFIRPWGFDVGEITVPVVIWHGDDDRNAPLSHAQAIAAAIPDAELIVWTGMGHLTAIDRLDDVFAHLLKVGSK
ncbi:MAG TPA: alpha/beta hydrolase [Acidimicrobiales bacterium]|nr:alpha/beta hydrolase [Acidimicrobiales bacterium]